MKQRTLFSLGITIISGVLLNTIVYGQTQSSRIYYSANDSFTKVMAKNRSQRGSKGSSYIKINGNEELKQAAKSGNLGSNIDSRDRKSKFVYKEIKNVHMNQKDLKDIGDKETLNLGLKIKEKKGSVSSTVIIKNSKFRTDRRINAGVESSSQDSSGITSTSIIQNTNLIGKD